MGEPVLFTRAHPAASKNGKKFLKGSIIRQAYRKYSQGNPSLWCNIIQLNLKLLSGKPIDSNAYFIHVDIIMHAFNGIYMYKRLRKLL